MDLLANYHSDSGNESEREEEEVRQQPQQNIVKEKEKPKQEASSQPKNEEGEKTKKKIESGNRKRNRSSLFFVDLPDLKSPLLLADDPIVDGPKGKKRPADDEDDEDEDVLPEVKERQKRLREAAAAAAQANNDASSDSSGSSSVTGLFSVLPPPKQQIASKKQTTAAAATTTTTTTTISKTATSTTAAIASFPSPTTSSTASTSYAESYSDSSFSIGSVNLAPPTTSTMPSGMATAAAIYDWNPVEGAGAASSSSAISANNFDSEKLNRISGGRFSNAVVQDINFYDQIGRAPGEEYKPPPEEPDYAALGSIKRLKDPTQVQKKKHQLAWLARFALENEKKINDRISSGLESRRQSQAKYGF